MALVQDPPTAPVNTDLKVPTTVATLPVETPKSETQTQSHVNGIEPQTKPKIEIEEHPIDQVRDVKVAVIGAGLAGVSAGVLLPAKLPGIDLTIYDKNADVGGTWFENTYPGVRCDIPAHAYQSCFDYNTDWTEEFAQGHEIREYWQKIARKYNVYDRLRLKQKIKKAEWLADEAKWELTIEDLNDGHVYQVKHDFVISAVGHFNHWRLPDYPGIDSFKGPLFHSSNWQHDVDLKGKRIALIGNGASGLQVLPSIQPLGSHIDHYARNRTWVVDSFGPRGVRRLEPNYIPEELRESFKKDEKKYLEYRKEVESGYFQRFASIFKGTKENEELRAKWTKLMLDRVKPELADKIIPDFPPICRRPTPGPGYLEALSQPNVSYIQTPIERFTETGIVTVDGVQRDVDVVICSTGANVDFVPPFPIIANGVNIQDAWKPGGKYGYPHLYLGMAAPGFPNLSWIGGPYAGGYSGTVPNSFENQVVYVAKVIRKFRSQGIRTIVPSEEATKDFIEYCDAFFPRTVWTGNDDSSENNKNCSSWYNGGKPGGRVLGIFPGSAAAANYIRRDPRWEDYEYTYTNPSGNRFAWFGDGWTTREKAPEGTVDITPHLKVQSEIDLRTHYEGWWDV
ncbi:hypothetical protein VTN31DRAFT_3067 [Thermomyces dupontii]|uniref:uncharacterized protein n=1 Tax=Talaromyces thermophilus TaxID=28565 RepID=UPI003742A543